jgi:hypothetical protein
MLEPDSLGEAAGFESGCCVVVDAEPVAAGVILHD